MQSVLLSSKPPLIFRARNSKPVELIWELGQRVTNSITAWISFCILKCNFCGCVGSAFCLQDNDPEDSGNSAALEFPDHSLYEDSQLCSGSAASGSGSALSGSLGSSFNETSGHGTGREVQDLGIWCYMACYHIINSKILYWGWEIHVRRSVAFTFHQLSVFEAKFFSVFFQL